MKHKTNIFIKLFFILLIIFMIMPFVNVLALSLSSDLGSMEPGIRLWPKEFTTESYRKVWISISLWRPFVNNIIVTAIGTVIHVTLAAIAGYVLIQRDLPGKKIIAGIILFTMAIPGEGIMLPLYMLMDQLNLLNTLTSLVLSGLVSGFSIFLMRNYFMSIPYSLAEAAEIDGAGPVKIFTIVYLPLAKSGLACVALFEIVSRWNMFMPVVLYISDSSKTTLQVALREIIMPTSSQSGGLIVTPNVAMAGIVIAILPLIIAYPFVQKYFISGVNAGAVKE